MEETSSDGGMFGGHPLLGFPAMVETAHDVLDSECQDVGFESLLDLSQWYADGDGGTDELNDQTLNSPTLPDMNDPLIMEIYNSLSIFKNAQELRQLEFTDCDPSKLSALQALARVFYLRYQFDSITRTVKVEKYSHGPFQSEQESKLHEELNKQIASIDSTPLKGSHEPKKDETKSLTDVAICWKCKILKEKCDMQQPCKVCQRFDGVSTWWIWHEIGCRRGSFDELTAQDASLCLKDSPLFLELGSCPQGETEACLKDSSERLKEVLADLSVSPRKVALETLCQVNLAVTLPDPEFYLTDDLSNSIVSLAWEFIDNPLVKSTMHIESVEDTFEGIRAALAYESEDGTSSIVSLALKCVRLCTNILRLHNKELLRIDLHNGCDGSICHIQCVRDLGICLQGFWNAFLDTVIHKANEQEGKRWWLHSFYSLWLQGFVYRTIWSLRMRFGLVFENTWNNYQLALQVFTAAASNGQNSYDPLVTSWSLDDLHNKPSTELSQVRFYYLAQKAFDSRQWKTSNIRSSYDYLARMVPPRPVVSGWGQDKVVIDFQQLNKPLFPGAIENSVRTPRRQRLFLFGDDTDDEDLYAQAPPPRNRPKAKRRANSPPADTIGSYSETASALTRSPLFGASPTHVTYSPDFNSAVSPLRLNSPTGILGTHSLSRSPRMPERSGYSSDMSSQRLNGTPLRYVSSHESLSTGLRSTSVASTTSWAVGFHMCRCCPKKPKKFKTQEELRAHEAEKPHECNFCGNRFKSKTEAERHQNSLHVRRHSWSCSVFLVAGYDRAFHDSANHPGRADVCGYCGDEFMRSGENHGIYYAVDRDWDERLRHLQETHRFRECNASKKFYRADHFRQHLKHSHGGTSGKWTTMLENVCMLDEEPPQRPNDGNVT